MRTRPSNSLIYWGLRLGWAGALLLSLGGCLDSNDGCSPAPGTPVVQGNWRAFSSHEHNLTVDATGTVQMAWTDGRDSSGSFEVYTTRWDGSSFGSQIRVTQAIDTGGWRGYPSLAVGPGNLLAMVYEGSGGPTVTGNAREVFYRESTDGGLAWSPEILVSSDDGFASWLASVAIDGIGTVHVAWEDNRDNEEIFYRRRTGGTWGPEVRLSFDPAQSNTPSIAADTSGVVHVVWIDERNQVRSGIKKYEVYWRRSPDAGLTWEPEELLSLNDGSTSSNPMIAVDGLGRAQVVWADFRDGADPFCSGNARCWTEIYTRRWSGSGWGPEERLSMVDGRFSDIPAVAIDERDQVHVVWLEVFSTDRLELFYRKGMPGVGSSISWGPIERVTCSNTNKQNPSIAPVGQTPVFLWWQLRDGFMNLFFKGP